MRIVLRDSSNSIFGSAGSGVIISADGLILMNAHVIEGEAENITVRFHRGGRVVAGGDGPDP